MKKICGNCKYHSYYDECEKILNSYMVSFKTEGEQKNGEYETWIDYQEVAEIYTDSDFGCVLWEQEEK